MKKTVKIKVIGTIHAMFIESTTSNVTKISNDPFPDGQDNFFYEQVAEMPRLIEERTIGASKFKIPANYVELPDIPEWHKYKFDENGNYK